MSDPIRDLKRELLAAAERQQRHATERAGHGRLRAHLGRDRLLASIATLVIAAVVALLFASPWSDSPGFLDRAQAALTADPRDGPAREMGGDVELDRPRVHHRTWTERDLDRSSAAA